MTCNSRRIVSIKSNNIIIVIEELIVVYLFDSLEGEIVWNKYESYWSMSDIGVEFLLINFHIFKKMYTIKWIIIINKWHNITYENIL